MPSEINIKKRLIENALKGQWDDVVKIYTENSEASQIKINNSGDTALHLAVSDGKVKIVKKLIAQDREASALPENIQRNTPLHVAASMGNVDMCKLIADHYPSSVGVQNNDGETPFFLAAFYGRKKAFLFLHRHCRTHDLNGSDYARRSKNGDTILHSAISGEYFDLAFHIISFYREKLVYSINVEGLSPLHILAAKSTAFKSGSRLGLFEKILYCFIIVPELKKLDEDNLQSKEEPQNSTKNSTENNSPCVGFFKFFFKGTEEKKNGGQTAAEDPENRKGRDQEWLPANYDTCYEFFKFGFKGILTVLNLGKDKKNGGRRDAKDPEMQKERHEEWLPANYDTCYAFFKLGLKGILIVLGLGYATVNKIEEKKRKHTWAFQVMKELLPDKSSAYDYAESVGQQPSDAERPEILLELKETAAKQPETPILIAAKNGVTEIVDRILKLFPAAVHDANEDGKNVVLLAVQNRQPHVYQFFLNKREVLDKESVFRKVDKDGNSALHLAGKLGDYKPWRVPGEALQMQWELKWYEFVKDSMPFHFYTHFNKQGKTSKEVFNETHKELVKSGGEWLTKTSESCSVVAALIATVAFATSATIPGGVKSDTGTPLLERKPAFDTFAIASLIALCFSVTALVMFLAILTSRFQPKDFGKDLPGKLFIGLTSLLVSIAAVLISFCAGHFFVLKHRLGYWALPVYAVACLPISFYAFAQFSLYIDVLRAILKKVPQRSYSSATGPS